MDASVCAPTLEAESMRGMLAYVHQISKNAENVERVGMFNQRCRKHEKCLDRDTLH